MLRFVLRLQEDAKTAGIMKAVGKNIKKRLKRESFYKEQLKARRTGLRALKRTNGVDTRDAIAKDTAINSWLNKGHATAVNDVAGLGKKATTKELTAHGGSYVKMYRDRAKNGSFIGSVTPEGITQNTNPLKSNLGRRTREPKRSIRDIPSKISVRLRARVLQNQRKSKVGSTK